MPPQNEEQTQPAAPASAAAPPAPPAPPAAAAPPQPIPQVQPAQDAPSQARQSLQQLAQTVPNQLHYDPAGQPPPAYDNIYTEICTEIIKAQSKIMGLDLAIEQAQGVQGLTIDPQTLHSTVTGDGSKVINDLIQQFKNFFGYAAVEVCREATATLLTRLPLDRTPVLLHPQQA